MVVLIPAYEPNERLIKLIYELKAICNYNIVIVDDGSGDVYKDVFTRAADIGCTVLTHKVNKGKGQALKTGFSYIKETTEEEGVVCADCDGQHLPKDIIKIGETISKHHNSIILGTRRFMGDVPFRSSFGNSITRTVFSFASGTKIFDTQTGLRGFYTDMLQWLCGIKGQRFEYEMNMLLEAVPSGYDFQEVDINTVYLEQNKSSHFHALKDSVRVYLPILKFSLSSILSAILDFILLGIIQFYTSNLLIAAVGARVCSAIFNYTMNRVYVFSKFKSSSIKKSLPRYFVLALFVLLANYGVINVYNIILGIPLFYAKVFTEGTIFLFSFWSQRKFVFKN
jgi:glycosyltransferase involved in cell wall biosynthesis